MSDLVKPGTTFVRVNWQLFIVDCAWCTSSLALGPDVVLEDGTIRRGLAWGHADMRCWDCGMVSGPILGWPADPQGIMAILVQRPNIWDRNWVYPETLDDLMFENLAHGILPAAVRGIEAAPGDVASLMITAGDRIVGGVLLDALPSAESRRRELET
jgi:hypothetical protein